MFETIKKKHERLMYLLYCNINVAFLKYKSVGEGLKIDVIGFYALGR